MNDADDLLETELRRLQPAAPRAHLATAIARDLQAPAAPAWPRHVRLSLWASWSLTAAAAALAIVAWWPAARRADAAAASATLAAAGDPAEAGVVPVGSSNVLCDARDEGFVLLDDGRPARQVRLHFVDTVRLRDADAGASIAVSRPREEVRFVPVSFY